jgi:transposase InsO family protein
MDFKGEFALHQGGRCFPLTILDDHSRFALGLQACSSVRTAPTQAVLIDVFRRYGLPLRITCDNGPPWGIQNSRYTKLSVWLMRLGISVSHSRPHHPQTQGKDERFHRTLEAEVLKYLVPETLAVCQQRFTQWRQVYNNERPHEALGLQVPANRYQPSSRAYPETLPALEYGPSDIVKRVHPRGHIKYKGREFYLSMAFAGQQVALRYTTTDGMLEVYFAQHCINTIYLN